MPAFYLDSSALVKRYVPEIGSDVVNVLFNPSANRLLIVSMMAVAESIAALNRKKNSAELTATALVSMIDLLLTETDSYWKPTLSNQAIQVSLQLITRHNVNATDALHLHLAKSLDGLMREFEMNVVVVASDQRLLRAAKVEGLTTIDPEQISEAELKELL